MKSILERGTGRGAMGVPFRHSVVSCRPLCSSRQCRTGVALGGLVQGAWRTLVLGRALRNGWGAACACMAPWSSIGHNERAHLCMQGLSVAAHGA